MSGDGFNFEPVYAALATFLTNLANAPTAVVGSIASGTNVVTGVTSDMSKLLPGLAVIGSIIPIGTTIQSINLVHSTVTITQPASSDFTGSLSVGYVPTDSVSIRILRHWTNVPAAQQPAMFMAEADEVVNKRPAGQPSNTVLNVKIYIYANAPDINTPVAPTINLLLRQLRLALQRDTSGPGAIQNRQTLGGLVYDLYIQGKIEKDEGYLGQQGVAVVPIIIQANGP
jgi:hypothetical protein